MTIITGDAAAAQGLDPEREWIEIECPAGHRGYAQNHGTEGAVAECGTCDSKFEYGARAAETSDSIESLGKDQS